LTGLPKLSWSWTVITLPARGTPRGDVGAGRRGEDEPFAPAAPTSNAALVAPVSDADEAVRV